MHSGQKVSGMGFIAGSSSDGRRSRDSLAIRVGRGPPWRRGRAFGGSAFALAPRKLGGKRIQWLCPEPPIPVQPRVDLLQRRWIDGVEAAGAIRSHSRESTVAQHPEMLRHRRLGDPELGLHDGADLAGRLLAVCEQFQDPAPHRITEDIERMHADIISALPYISLRRWFVAASVAPDG
jgi:hypothetical protein